MRSDPFNITGADSALRLAQQYAKKMDLREMALDRLDAMLSPGAMLRKQAQSALDEVLRVGRSLDFADMVPDLVQEERDMAQRLADDASLGFITRAIEEMGGREVYNQAAADRAIIEQVNNRLWPSMKQGWGAYGPEAWKAVLDEQVSDLAQRLVQDATRHLPPDVHTSVAALVRSLDFDPLRDAAQQVRDELQRIEEELAELESFDEVEERIERADLSAFRKALTALLVDAFRKSKESGIQTWLMLNLWYSALSPLARMLVQVAVSTAVSTALSASNAPAPAPQAAPTAHVAPRPAQPSSRPSEVVFAERDVALRAGPQSTHSIIGRIPARQFMRIQKRRHGWYYVVSVVPTGEGTRLEGWVKAKGLKHADAETLRMLWCLLTVDASKEQCPRE